MDLASLIRQVFAAEDEVSKQTALHAVATEVMKQPRHYAHLCPALLDNDGDDSDDDCDMIVWHPDERVWRTRERVLTQCPRCKQVLPDMSENAL